MSEELQRYLGAYAVCVRDGAILMVRQSADAVDGGRWTLPGGGVLPGEHPDDAVLRELREETGLTGTRGSVLAAYSRAYYRTPERPRPPVHFVGLLYAVEAGEGELVHEIENTTDRAEWIPIADLRRWPLVELGMFVADLLERA